MSAIDRLAPQNREAEEAVLGSLLIDPDAILEVKQILTPPMFYSQVNRWCYEAVLSLDSRNEPLDSLTLIEELRRREKLEEVGGEPCVIGLVSAVPTSINAMAYARIVNAAYIRRTIINMAGKMANMAYNEDEDINQLIDSVYSGVRGLIDSLNLADDTSATYEEVVKQTIDHMEAVYNGEAKSGMAIGLPDVDSLIGGINRGDVFIIAARPGTGKSSLVSEIVNANKKRYGLMYSLEMTKRQMGNRFISQEASIPLAEIKRPGDDTIQRAHSHYPKVTGARFIIEDSVRFSELEKLCQDAERHYIKNDGKMDFIIIDHIGLMHSTRFKEKNNRVAELSYIAIELKRLAKRLDCVVIELSQLNRGVESRADKRPMLSDLKDSGSLEENASIVLFIYRDDYYHADTSDRPGIAELIIAKNRDGMTGNVDMLWKADTVSFKSLIRNSGGK